MMTSRTTGTLIAVMLMLLSNSCSQPDTPEQIIITQLSNLEAGIEEKDTEQVLDLIHDNFGTRTGADKLWIKRTMAFYMLRHPNIKIVTSNLHIELEPEQQPDTAHARFSALVTGGEGLIPEQGALYQIETEWRLQGEQWQLVYADWQRP